MKNTPIHTDVENELKKILESGECYASCKIFNSEAFQNTNFNERKFLCARHCDWLKNENQKLKDLVIDDFLNEPTIITWEKLKEGDYPVEWLVDGLIEKNTITTIYGESGSAKSWFTEDLACCLVGKCSFLNKYKINEPQKVLVIGLEDREARIRERINLLQQGSSYNFFDGYLAFTGFKEGYDIKNLMKFEKAIELHKANILIIDSLQWTFSGFDENRSSDMKEVMQAYKYLINKYRITIVLVHHTNKGDFRNNSMYAFPRDARGSTTVINLSDQRIGLKARLDGLFTVNFQSKGQPQQLFGFKLINESAGIKLQYIDVEKEKEQKKELNKNIVLEVISDNPDKLWTIPEIVKDSRIKVSDETLRKYMKDFKQEGLVEIYNGNPKRYKYIPNQEKNDSFGNLELVEKCL